MPARVAGKLSAKNQRNLLKIDDFAASWVTTLTKAEYNKYTQAMTNWAAKQEKTNSTPLAVTENNGISDSAAKKTVVLN